MTGVGLPLCIPYPAINPPARRDGADFRVARGKSSKNGSNPTQLHGDFNIIYIMRNWPRPRTGVRPAIALADPAPR